MRFTRGEIKRKAKALYSVCSPVLPDWQQIRNITSDVWRERAAKPGDGTASDA